MPLEQLDSYHGVNPSPAGFDDCAQLYFTSAKGARIHAQLG
jgi:cephalosporin-C deacetylase-like acetyl esterase